MMKNKIWLVRHGESAANAGEKTTFNWAIPLSKLGEQQSEVIAKILFASLPNPSRIIASPYLRARQTAAPYVKLIGIEPELVDAWHETDYLQSQEVAAPTTIEERQVFRDKFWTRSVEDQNYRDPGPDENIESVNDFYSRVNSALGQLADEIQRNNFNEDVVIFTHGNFMNALLLILAGDTPRQIAEWFRDENLRKHGGIWIRNCQVIELSFDGKKFAVEKRDVFPGEPALPRS